MRNLRLACTASLLLLVVASPAVADVVSDEAAAILIFPRVLVERASEQSVVAPAPTLTTVDTVIQISNVSAEAVNLHCFYVSANGHCSLSGSACQPGDNNDFSCPSPVDLCLPGWIETDFDVVLTPRQPIAWRAGVGLSGDLLPLQIPAQGPTGQTNAGTLVPPVLLEEVNYAPNPVVDRQRRFFAGELKCVVVDGIGRAIARNDVKGEATVIEQRTFSFEDIHVATPRVEKYNGIGIKAIDGDANGDGVLELGGEANEYNGCAQVLIADHLFDFVSYNVVQGVVTEFTLVPCTQDLRLQIPGSTTAQFLVFNEFEQRFSTSRRIDCFFKSIISHIDTPNESRSIFSSAVSGTFAAQTRIRGVQTGLLGVISESTFFSSPPFGGDAAFHFAMQGEREAPDRITLP